MRGFSSLILVAVLFITVPPAWAQRTPRAKGAGSGSSDPNGIVNRMMKFDSDHDGKLSRDEVEDDRLLAAFDRVDANGDGSLTKAELTAYAAKSNANSRGNNRPNRRGPFDGPPGGGPGMGMRGPRPKPGEVLPQMLQQQLKLTADQKAQLQELQKDVDARLAKILTSDQKLRLEEMRNQGPPPGGPPPGGFDGGPGEDGVPPPPPDF